MTSSTTAARTGASTSAAHPESTEVLPRPRGFRPDIEGLRAIAVVMVLAAMAGVTDTRGMLGLDVFLVITGYLLTGALVRELDVTGGVRWGRFVARRARRLLPAATLVIVVTALACWAMVRGAGRHLLGQDVVGAATGVLNVLLAHRSVDVLDTAPATAPLQHLWALSVHEQFSLGWPLLLAALGLVLRRASGSSGIALHPTRRLLAGLVLTLALPSLVWALYQASVAPHTAYVSTWTRLWELGVGALLAIWVHHRHPFQNRWVTLAGWAGLVAVLWSPWGIPVDAAWPGLWTVLPTVGAALVILSGWSLGTLGPAPVLGWLPLVWLGRLSYELYLWAWPVLAVAQHLWGDGAGVRAGALAATLLLAWVTHRYAVNRVRSSPRLRPAGRALGLGAALMAAGVLAGLPLILSPSPFRTQPSAGGVPALATLGAATLGPTPSGDAARYAQRSWDWVTPDPQRAADDRPEREHEDCLVDEQGTQATRCVFGDPRGRVTIALVGDAKVLQWLPALEESAGQRHWRITTYVKRGCVFVQGQTALDGRHYRSCDDWNSSVLSALEKDRPTLVLTSGHARTVWAGDHDSTNGMVTGLAARWQAVRSLGSRIAVIADNPSAPSGLEECMTRHAHDLTACSFSRAEAVNAGALPLQREAASVTPGTELIDLTPWLCPVESCPTVIGHVLVNGADQQVTATYARTLAPVLRSSVDKVLASE